MFRFVFHGDVNACVVDALVDGWFMDDCEWKYSPTPYPPSLMRMALSVAKRRQREENTAGAAVDTFSPVSGLVRLDYSCFRTSLFLFIE